MKEAYDAHLAEKKRNEEEGQEEEGQEEEESAEINNTDNGNDTPSEPTDELIDKIYRDLQRGQRYGLTLQINDTDNVLLTDENYKDVIKQYIMYKHNKPSQQKDNNETDLETSRDMSFGVERADTVESTVDTVEDAAETVEDAAETVEDAADTVESTVDTGEDAADTGEDAADTGEDAADTGEDAADTGEDAADTGERCG